MTVNELFASRPADFVIHAADHQKLEWQEIGRFRYEFNEQTSSNEQVKKLKSMTALEFFSEKKCCLKEALTEKFGRGSICRFTLI